MFASISETRVTMIMYCCVKWCRTQVSTLTDTTFESNVKSGEWIVEFYAPWVSLAFCATTSLTQSGRQCGHCKKLEPTWTALPVTFSQAGIGKVNVGKVDITAEKGVSSHCCIAPQ